jgi:hypothetical protein
LFFRYKYLAVLLLLFLTHHHQVLALPQQQQQSQFPKYKKFKPSPGCSAAASAAGVNLTNFMGAVTHMVHSITLQDIRYFFDERFPEANDVPTVNTDLSSPEMVLSYAPSKPSVFKFPGGAHFDQVMQANDDPTKYFVRGTTHLEDLAHWFHMAEMWLRASTMYREIVGRAAAKAVEPMEVCPCLLEVERANIRPLLENVALELRNYTTVPGEEEVRRAPRDIRYPNTPRPHRIERSALDEPLGEIFVNPIPVGEVPSPASDAVAEAAALAHAPTSDAVAATAVSAAAVAAPAAAPAHAHEEVEFWDFATDPERSIELPELRDAASWQFWKNEILEMDHPMEDQGVYNFAMYMFCKIRNLVGN